MYNFRAYASDEQPQDSSNHRYRTRLCPAKNLQVWKEDVCQSNQSVNPTRRRLIVSPLHWSSAVWVSVRTRRLRIFAGYVESKAITHTSMEFDASLERAKRHFAQEDAHFFLCDGEPCQQRRRFEATSDALQYEAERIGCRISPTACQGPCKQAPVALLRVGHGCELFAQFVRRREWEAVLDFAQRAAQAKTLLVDAGTAQPFRYDPIHEPVKPSAALESVRFLLGHFEGTVELPLEQRSIQKEVVGCWEAGGRFLSLRMAATYRRTNG